MRHYSQLLGLNKPKRVIATGGGSVNRDILQIIANIFECPVYVYSGGGSASTETAAIGAAYRALHAHFNYLLDDSKSKSTAQDTKQDTKQLLISFADVCSYARSINANSLSSNSLLNLSLVCRATSDDKTFTVYRSLLARLPKMLQQILTNIRS